MAVTKKVKPYIIQGITTNIKATSRAAIKIRDNYYTIEVTEERSLVDALEDVDLDKEYEDLFNSVNSVVDGQIKDIIDA